MNRLVGARSARPPWHKKIVAATALSVLVALVPAAPGRAADPPEGFQVVTVFSGLTNPTTIEFAADGRIFVAEKSGLIKVFDDLEDTTPTTFADLRTNVHNFWDRGLLGMALHPDFPATPNVYVLYAHDAVIGGTAPRWGTVGGTSDPCPTPPGATSDGCVVSGRLSKLVASGNTMVGPEQVLIEDWCQQYPSHSTGALEFGADGALYVSGGDGASFTFADFGQDGSPLNPCGDPPGAAGSTLTPPTAEGGALRSQDLRTPTDPTNLDGAILRVDPDTGAGLPDNPLASSPDANARRIIAYGLRNPFRFGIRPGTNEVWAGDVGWNVWEEINKITNPTDATVENFGWPCYEGTPRQGGYDGLNLNICENLYAQAGGVTEPFFAYNHSDKVVPGETCPVGGSSVAGVAFYDGGSYPEEYDGAMFFADYSRSCIWVMFENNGQPDPATRQTFVDDATGVVDIEIGPGGDLYYVNLNGSVNRIGFEDPDPPPPPTGSGYLSDFQWTSETNGWGPVERDMSNGEESAGDGATITLNGQTYAKGIGAHAHSEIRFNMGGECTSFTAAVGVDDEVGPNGTIAFKVLADGQELFDSGTMTGSSPTQTVDVDVTDKTQLLLQITDGGDNINFDHGDWADAFVTCSEPPSGTRYLSDVDWAFVSNGLGPAERDESNGGSAVGDGNTITLNGQTYAKGVGVSAVSQIQYNMAAQCTRFISEVGVDDEVGTAGSVQFRVVADGSVLFNSGLMTGASATQSVDVDVTGRSLIKLQVGHGGDGTTDDHADWAGARFECEGDGGTNETPTATISLPLGTTTWKVNDSIPFSGSATDPEDGALPASALDWDVILHHCPSTCHEHPLETFEGTTSGSFVAPDHEYPSHLEFRLTATDSGGKADTESVLVQPQTVPLTFATNPEGLQLAVNAGSEAGPFVRTVIVGSTNSVGATSPQALGGTVYEFLSWSDGGAQTHQVVAPAEATTYTATFEESDGTALVISNVVVAQVNRRAAFIEWTTNVPATSQVEYGTTPAYGSLSPLQPELVVQHSVKIKNLERQTTYNFRVLSEDALGNPAVSGNFTFTTP